MKYELLKAEAESITMPDGMKHRIVRNCNKQIANTRKDIFMKNDNNYPFFRKPVTVFTIAVVCLSLTFTAVSASGELKGFFQDITDYRGAVIGTTYEQATDEIHMCVTVSGSDLTAQATFSVPQEFPYREAEKLGIEAYQIVDAGGKVVKEGTAEPAKVINGQAAFSISLDGIDSGSYKLIVTSFVSEKKADQPLSIIGHWECDFTK